MNLVAVAAYSVVLILSEVTGHGHVWVPPQRSSMWRAGFPVPVNYNDMALNCGGFANQWDVNGGRCGVCGDPYQGPYDNDYDGKYVTGIVGGVYNQGDNINIIVNLTAHHSGYFQFRLCPNGSLTGDVLQECLDRNIVTLETLSGLSERYYPGNGPALYTIPAILPPGINCDHCVLQWTYRVGNSWGKDDEGEGLGHGRQEHFINCADIRILPVDGATYLRSTLTSSSPPSVTHTATTLTTVTTKPQSPSSCVAAGAWTGMESMTSWCRFNCPFNCPSSHCTCT